MAQPVPLSTQLLSPPWEIPQLSSCDVQEAGSPAAHSMALLAVPSLPPLWDPLFGQVLEEKEGIIWGVDFASTHSQLLSAPVAKRPLCPTPPIWTFLVPFAAVLPLPTKDVVFVLMPVVTLEARPPV